MTQTLALLLLLQLPMLQPVRPVESDDIQALRATAQAMMDNSANLIATYDQTIGPKAHYQVRVIDGQQVPKQELPSMPLHPILQVGAEWSMLANLISKELKLRIERIEPHHYRYHAAAEDQVAWFKDCGFRCHLYSMGTHGEVWTNEQGQITRITQILESNKKMAWMNLQIVVTYQDAKPQTILLTGDHGKGHYATGGTFTNYHQFAATVEVKIGME